jgi:hypothetical protein
MSEKKKQANKRVESNAVDARRNREARFQFRARRGVSHA